MSTLPQWIIRPYFIWLRQHTLLSECIDISHQFCIKINKHKTDSTCKGKHTLFVRFFFLFFFLFVSYCTCNMICRTNQNTPRAEFIVQCCDSRWKYNARWMQCSELYFRTYKKPTQRRRLLRSAISEETVKIGLTLVYCTSSRHWIRLRKGCSLSATRVPAPISYFKPSNPPLQTQSMMHLMVSEFAGPILLKSITNVRIARLRIKKESRYRWKTVCHWVWRNIIRSVTYHDFSRHTA